MQFVAGQASMQSSITTRCFPSADLWCKSNGTSRSRIQWISSRPSSAQCRATMSNFKNEIPLRSEFSSSLFLRSTFGLQESHNYVKKTGISARYGAFNSDTAAIETDDHLEANKRAQVSKRLERTAGYFRRLGSLGFWGQLVCTVVSAIILAFSIVITGAATAPVTLYLTTAGIVAAFLSVFWSFGYMRLSQRLRATIDDPTKAPPRAQVVKNLKNGIVINLLGMGATLLGMQATVGVLVAKALTSSAQPFLQGQGYSPVLALDVFVVQASANALVSHFLGLVFSLELLRSVTLSQPPPENVLPKAV